MNILGCQAYVQFTLHHMSIPCPGPAVMFKSRSRRPDLMLTNEPDACVVQMLAKSLDNVQMAQDGKSHVSKEAIGMMSPWPPPPRPPSPPSLWARVGGAVLACSYKREMAAPCVFSHVHVSCAQKVLSASHACIWNHNGCTSCVRPAGPCHLCTSP